MQWQRTEAENQRTADDQRCDYRVSARLRMVTDVSSRLKLSGNNLCNCGTLVRFLVEDWERDIPKNML